MKRKLASVQSVSALIPIEGADNIELAKIEGWQCVVKKGEFQVGDLGAYFEIDSIPPDTPEFQFLWAPKPKVDDEGNVAVPQWDGLRPDKFRIRTMKLRGALSQGLLMPLSDIISDWQSRQENGAATFPPDLLTHGADLTDFLGVLKYEPPQYDGIGRAPFPGYVPRTDEMRVQSCPEVLEEMRGLPYIITEKVDGQSGTFLIDRRDDTLHCCSRNHSVGDGPDSRYFGIARKYGLEEILRQFPNYAIQGELFGPGIQGNRLKVSQLGLVVFNIFDISEARYLDDQAMRDFCDKHWLLPVRVLDQGESFNYSLEELLALAEGKYDSGQEREGIVIRPKTERNSAVLQGRLSFKAISNRFLLKNPDA